MEYNYSLIEKAFTEYILNYSGPNKEQDDYREEKYKIIKNVIMKAFQEEQDIKIKIFSFGSFPFKSYHRDSDIDMTIILLDKTTDKLITSYSIELLTKVLNIIENSLRQYFSQHYNEEYLERIDADVRLIKCKFEGVSFDISIDNFVGLFKFIFMHNLEKKYLDPFFYKRTLLLIKSWCYYEGNILGSNIGLLGSYALEVLVIYMFNNYKGKFNSELEAFFTFFNMMSKINWENQIVTIYGIYDIVTLSKYNLNLESFLSSTEQDKDQKIIYTEISDFVKQFERFNDIEKVQIFNINSKTIVLSKYNMYIIDPIYNTNNLGKSVNFHNSSRIKELFDYMDTQCQEVIKLKTEKVSPYNYFNEISNLFSTIITSNDSELFKIKLSEPKILIVPLIQNSKNFSGNIGNDFEKDFEEENEFNQLFMFQEDEDLEDKIDNQDNLEPLCLCDNISGGFNNNINLQNNGENENKGNPQSLISKKTINFIKKYFADREDKDNFEEYNYETNNEVNIIEEFEKTISI
jgi:predicted nucleotidyltransferase